MFFLKKQRKYNDKNFFAIACFLTGLWLISTLVSANVYARPTGEKLYNRYCLACHGHQGDGKGPASPWLSPPPRDFTKAIYKWRSTPSGTMASDQDLVQSIQHGISGTSMHAFDVSLNKESIQSLVNLLKQFALKTPPRATPVTIPKQPAMAKEIVAHGKNIWSSLGCVACHGEKGEGDGPSAATLLDYQKRPARPYSLTRGPLRRPGADKNIVRSIYTTLITGLDGTPMPSYAHVSSKDLWAVSMFIDSLRKQYKAEKRPQSIAKTNRTSKVQIGHWPGDISHAEAAIFGKTITLQNTPPSVLTPAQSSLSAKQCGRCHAAQTRQWKQSLHAKTMSPGVLGQLGTMSKQDVASCSRCHAPLAEQLAYITPAHRGNDNVAQSYKKNRQYDQDLMHEGINCASCHVRMWKRFGPENIATDLLKQPHYPKEELAIYERSDFCLPCHQLPPDNPLEGKPLLNTYIEWLEGPYMPRGIQCQHCHMPNREHQWLGIHDKTTFLQGIALDSSATYQGNTIIGQAKLTNIGAGHYLPTTPTPAVWLSIQLIDKKGKPVTGTYVEKRIGRHIQFNRYWKEIEDTRIPPGKSISLVKQWQTTSAKHATAMKVEVRVSPDDYYEGFFIQKLKRRNLTHQAKNQFSTALQNTRNSKYIAKQKIIPLTPYRKTKRRSRNEGY